MSLHFLNEEAEGAPYKIESVEPLLDDKSPERSLVCARCGHVITSSAARLQVNGRHTWTRKNPHGYIHHFGCFASAPGCASVGVPSRKDTWFAGYFWQIQNCGGCDEHLGWLFFEGMSSFYGLIVEALVESQGAGAAN